VALIEKAELKVGFRGVKQTAFFDDPLKLAESLLVTALFDELFAATVTGFVDFGGERHRVHAVATDDGEKSREREQTD
jgi:hypothetical protein